MNSDYEKMLHNTICMTDEDALKILNGLLPSTNAIPRKSSKDITSLSLQIALSRAINALKEKVETPKVLYLCKYYGKYGDDTNGVGCRYTKDVRGALNFGPDDSCPGTYVEREPLMHKPKKVMKNDLR